MLWGFYRIVALVLTTISVSLMYHESRLLWISQYYAILFGHYFLALVFSREKVIANFKTPKGIFAVCTFMLPILFLYKDKPNFVFPMFCVHFALSEVYSFGFVNREIKFPENFWRKFFVFCHFAFLCIAYTLAFNHEFAMWNDLNIFLPWASDTFLYPITILFGTTYFLLVFLKSHEIFGQKLNKVILNNFVVPEILMLLAIPFCKAYTLHFGVGVYYHLIFWIFAPLPNLFGGKKRLIYLTQTFVLSLGFFILSPYVFHNIFNFDSNFTSGHMNDWTFQAQLWGFIHISMTLFTSKLNPNWIIRFSDPLEISTK